MNEVKDMALAPSGRDKIAWVRSYMPILNAIRERFEKQQPFKGMTFHSPGGEDRVSRAGPRGGRRQSRFDRLQPPFHAG